jgi:hypothetical protein
MSALTLWQSVYVSADRIRTLRMTFPGGEGTAMPLRPNEI